MNNSILWLVAHRKEGRHLGEVGARNPAGRGRTLVGVDTSQDLGIQAEEDNLVERGSLLGDSHRARKAAWMDRTFSATQNFH